MSGIKFEDLSPEAQKVVIERNRHINTEDGNWDDSVISDCKSKLEELGFDDVEIGYTGFWSQGDGASFTFDNSKPPMFNSELFSEENKHLLSGWESDEKENIEKFIKNQCDKWDGVFTVRSERNGRYLHEKSVQYYVERDGSFDLDTAEEFNETFSGWETPFGEYPFSAISNYQDGSFIVNDLGKGHHDIICVESESIFSRYKNVEDSKIIDYNIEKFNLKVNPAFFMVCAEVYPHSFIDEFTFETWESLSYVEKVNCLIEYLGYKMLFDGIESETIYWNDLYAYNPLFIENMDEKLDDLASVIDSNFQMWAEAESKSIYSRLQEEYEQCETDESVKDTLEINDYFDQTFTKDGEVYMGDADQFSFEELDNRAKTKVSNMFYETYDFEEFHQADLEEFIKKLTGLGFTGVTLIISTDNHQSHILFKNVDFSIAKSWMLAGIPDAENIMSVTQVPADYVKVLNQNRKEMIDGINLKFGKYVYDAYMTDISDENIAQSYSDMKFYADGTEVIEEDEDE